MEEPEGRKGDNSGSKNAASSLPSSQIGPVTSAHWDEADFMTATDVLPVQVALERLEIGRWKYVGTIFEQESSDLELLYELESSDLLIKCNVRGHDGTGPPATFRMRDVSAADLSLVCVVPGSLESMVARLVLETEEPIEYSVCGLESEESKEEPEGSVSASGKGDRRSSDDDDTKQREKEVKTLNSRIVVLTASVHETGHLRDILLFLKGGYAGKVSPDALYLSPKSSRKAHESTDSTNASDLSRINGNQQITFLESLPFWVRYIPWWVYSRNMRISIQNVFFIYSLFSVIWASWQLYRNVNVIHHVLEPIIVALRDVYLSSVMEISDWVLALLTDFWMRFLSPLNILQGLLLAPVLQAAIQLRTIFLPLVQALYSVVMMAWRCLPNTQLLTALRNLALGLYSIACALGQNLWLVMAALTKPLYFIWQTILNSRVAVASLDLNRIKLSWVVNLVTGSARAIGLGMAKLFGYTSNRRKVIRAQQHPSQYLHSPSPRHVSKHPRMPVYYSSPLTKAD